MQAVLSQLVVTVPKADPDRQVYYGYGWNRWYNGVLQNCGSWEREIWYTNPAYWGRIDTKLNFERNDPKQKQIFGQGKEYFIGSVVDNYRQADTTYDYRML